MKRIIFRRPFVTKYDREMAASFMDSSKCLLDASDVCFENGDTDGAYELTMRAAEHMHIAARHLGFRDILDMNRYMERHGKF